MTAAQRMKRHRSRAALGLRIAHVEVSEIGIWQLLVRHGYLDETAPLDPVSLDAALANYLADRINVA
jgi:hypothetical protein